MTLTLSLPNVSNGKFRPNFQISFCKILTNNVQVQAESCHLNGHITGFGPQTQKLESPYKTPSNTLACSKRVKRNGIMVDGVLYIVKFKGVII